MVSCSQEKEGHTEKNPPSPVHSEREALLVGTLTQTVSQHHLDINDTNVVVVFLPIICSAVVRIIYKQLMHTCIVIVHFFSLYFSVLINCMFVWEDAPKKHNMKLKITLKLK